MARIAIEKLIERLAAHGCTVEACGSRVTCQPAPEESDRDYLVAVPDRPAMVSKIVEDLHEAQFRWEGAEHYQSAIANTFMSWRRDDINLIVTSNATFVARHRAATHVCQRLNLMNKQDRIAVFQAVLYANKWEAV